MKIGYFQFKPEFCKPDENIEKIESALKDKNFDLIVLPELANSGYFFSSFDELLKTSEEIPDGIFCQSLKKIAKDKNAVIVSGISEKAGDKYYNSSILVYPSGEIKTYRKLHLFYDEKLWFAKSENPFEVYSFQNDNVKDVKLGMMICFDWIFPESARTLALKGVQVLCHPSNLVMPYCQDAMVTRALENRIFTVTCNRTGTDVNNEGKELTFTGMSEICRPDGNIIHRGCKDYDEVFIVEINPEEALNKYVNEKNNVFEDRREEFYK
jgi:predicted amidohydrolase